MTSVLIDGYALSDGSGHRGIGTYLSRIITGLAQRPDFAVEVLAQEDVRLPDGARRAPVRPLAPRRLRTLEHDLRLPGRLRTHQAEVFQSPAQHPPRHTAMPWVQTLHDLTPLTWPHPQLARDRRRWLRVGQRLRGAAAVVAVSRFSADQGIRHLALDPHRVEVIPLGVDHGLFHPAPAPETTTPYLLHVAAWGPHKGFAEAMAVVALLAERGLPHRLVLVGPQDDWMRAQVEAVVTASPRPDLVDVAGYVEDLPGIYRGATALLMTSRCEGFGLPVLEAMACGTPVVAFSNSSLTEVVGDGGVLVEDGDVRSMADAVRQLIAAPARHAELIERGLVHAGRFRWERTVESHAALLHSVAR